MYWRHVQVLFKVVERVERGELVVLVVVYGEIVGLGRASGIGGTQLQDESRCLTSRVNEAGLVIERW